MADTLSVADATALIFGAWSEDDLLRKCRQLAGLFGWRAYHTHASLLSEAGFPDLCLTRRGRLVVAELKREGRWPTLSAAGKGGSWRTGQTDWLRDLSLCEGAETYLWWPSDAADIATILDGGPTPGMACVARLEEWLREHPPSGEEAC